MSERWTSLYDHFKYSSYVFQYVCVLMYCISCIYFYIIYIIYKLYKNYKIEFIFPFLHISKQQVKTKTMAPRENLVNYARLYVNVNSDDSSLYHKYIQHLDNHNNSVMNNRYPNAGFDVYFPHSHAFPEGKTEFVSMDIQCEMHVYEGVTNSWKPVSYYSYPRSSISKTPLMLANCVGIIDSGYRGNLIGAFKNTSAHGHLVEQHTRLLQICAHNLQPIHVTLVDASFFEQTARGEGGFGSTGI